MNYTVAIKAPSGYRAEGAFREVAETVHYGLKALGKAGLPARTIVFGGHLLPVDHKSDDILYNLEQYDAPCMQKKGVRELFRRHEVWDYSLTNVDWWRGIGVAAKHVPIGYRPELRRITPAGEKDIDVLFYGAQNDRRSKVLEALRRRGLRVQHIYFGCYGVERDALIARSKIVLNVHYYAAAIFEIVRCSYLFTNSVCVVSETSKDVPPDLEGRIIQVPYDRLAETCHHFAEHPVERTEWADVSHDAFSRCAETEYLARVL